MLNRRHFRLLLLFLVCLCFQLFLHVLQEADEVKGATSWPDYYIDQLRSMSAVSVAITTHIHTLIPHKHSPESSADISYHLRSQSILFLRNRNFTKCHSRGRLC